MQLSTSSLPCDATSALPVDVSAGRSRGQSTGTATDDARDFSDLLNEQASPDESSPTTRPARSDRASAKTSRTEATDDSTDESTELADPASPSLVWLIANGFVAPDAPPPPLAADGTAEGDTAMAASTEDLSADAEGSDVADEASGVRSFSMSAPAADGFGRSAKPSMVATESASGAAEATAASDETSAALYARRFLTAEPADAAAPVADDTETTGTTTAQLEALAGLTASPNTAAATAGAASTKKVGQGRATASTGLALVDVDATSATAEAKIAGASDLSAEVTDVLNKLGLKKSLSEEQESLTKHTEAVGTNAAISRDTMSALTTTADLPSSTDAISTFAVSSADLAANAAVAQSEVTAETASAAHRAVESVLAVVDHFKTTGGQHGVNLKFNVSGVDLAVRVEIRGDQVQTTFRTDSPELRSALASEWRVVAADSTDRTQRVAEPVFTSNTGSHTSSGGSTNSDQRDAYTRQDGSSFDEFVAARSALRRSTAFATASVDETATTTSSTPAARPGRLHVLA